mmetsp:Transcript_41687/g.56832  ORF Transcript_41687/g.56832 Transcript_41687/m.56832 type:complete len:87 (+) Transcript_41687:295-555(+)
MNTSRLSHFDLFVVSVDDWFRSVSNWYHSEATPEERQHFLDFFQLVEDFEAARGFPTPMRRDEPEEDTVTIQLGPALSCEMRFRIS